ncbi:jg13634 [Pararge aegeria aegeria]|uniref:Jg13634 protein n=1 Tax=Pararge aegeria aegeria TaxID=348720 RepID=A0A8S4S8G2_9NEOP|nr:jg13634 [Pararge aegeria aegeria]
MTMSNSSQRYSTLANFTLSPIQASHNVTCNRHLPQNGYGGKKSTRRNSHVSLVLEALCYTTLLIKPEYTPLEKRSLQFFFSTRSTRFSSPAHSACSTDSSFAEQALADASVLLDREPNVDHLPYRLYKMAGEYWKLVPIYFIYLYTRRMQCSDGTPDYYLAAQWVFDFTFGGPSLNPNIHLELFKLDAF